MGEQPVTDIEAAYLAAGEAFVDLVDRIPVASLSDPGLGAWDLRGLIGHTCRALLTVPYYLGRPADRVVRTTSAEYFAATRDAVDHNAITRRGVETGESLGADPAVEVQKALESVRGALAGVRGTDPVIETAVGGMHLHDYLPTRTFELLVHSSDLAVATGRKYEAPSLALSQVLALVADLANLRGVGLDVVRVLTGRTVERELPSSLL